MSSTLESTAAAVVPLPVRRLKIDLSRGFDRLWNGGDAFRTHYFNALSMSFPVGEQFFIDAVRAGVVLLPPERQAHWAPTLRGFVGQEATHRFLHGQFNAELERQGLVNSWQRWAEWRIEKGRHLHPVNHVAVTAAYEHYTAVLATLLLVHPRALAGASDELARLWRWHAAEESEHKSVAIDLYRELGGSERRRIFWFVYISVLFMIEAARQTWLNLWRTGLWWRPRTFWQALRFMGGRGGPLRSGLGPALRYLRPGFHPDQIESPREQAEWFAAHAADYRVVGE